MVMCWQGSGLVNSVIRHDNTKSLVCGQYHQLVPTPTDFAILLPLASRRSAYRVPFVAIRLHLYRRCLLPIMRSTKMHMRMPEMAPTAAYETVLYDVADRVCTITLNRPEKLNAWTRQMHFDLRDAMQEAGSDPDVRAIILTGAPRGFCAGADMSGLQAIGAGAGASIDRSSKAANDLPGASTLAEFRMPYS